MKILITGDYCPIGRNAIAIDNKDFLVFEEFLSYSKNTDLSITNLEAPVTNSNTPIIKSGPNIKAKTNVLKPLKEAGFKLVTLANNHILDYGEKGVRDTIKNCESEGIEYVGAGENLEKAREPCFITIKEKKIGVLNFAENEYCAATNSTYGANPVNPITNYYDIIEAKKKVDYLIVIAHGGREHYQLPSPKLRERYRFYANSGADIVVGHHTHCYSGYEIYNETPIFYSLGNFIFDYKKKYQKGPWTQGYGVEFTIEKDNIDFKIVPFNQGREENPKLELLKGEEIKKFDTKIIELNTIISNDKLFNSAWNNYIRTQKKTYRASLFIQNKYIRALISKGLLPGFYFHSNKHKTLLLNLFRCETHNEIMIDVLKDDFKF